MRYLILFAFLLVSCRDDGEASDPVDFARVSELKAQADEMEAKELAKSPYRCFLLQGNGESDPGCG